MDWHLKAEVIGLEAVFNGAMLRVVALFCGYLMVLEEMRKALNLCRCVSYLARGPDKPEPYELPMQLTQYEIASMILARMGFSVIIVLYRFISSCVLAYGGTPF